MMVITIEIPTGRHPMRREIHVRQVGGPAVAALLPGSGETDRIYEVRTAAEGRVGLIAHDRSDGAEKLAAAALEHIATHAPLEIKL